VKPHTRPSTLPAGSFDQRPSRCRQVLVERTDPVVLAATIKMGCLFPPQQEACRLRKFIDVAA